ncbi:MAG: aspartate/glutamate racemase family protein, partial [Pseudomonadota bacterium]
ELGLAIKQNALSYGVANQLAAVTILPWTVSQVSATPKSHRHAFVDACKRTIIKDGVGAIIIGGGPLSGIADSIADDLPVPVLDGVRCAVEMVLMSPRKDVLS